MFRRCFLTKRGSGICVFFWILQNFQKHLWWLLQQIHKSNQFICTAGVAAGSIAASVQRMVYGGATGGIFRVLQATAAGGMSTLTKLTVGTAGVGLAKLMYDAYKKLCEDC